MVLLCGYGEYGACLGASTSGRVREAPTYTSFRESAGPSKTPQLDRSRQLNSEGLEASQQCQLFAISWTLICAHMRSHDVGAQGLIPRVKELAKLGGSLFLAFAPSIIVISVLFTVLYAVRMSGPTQSGVTCQYGAEPPTKLQCGRNCGILTAPTLLPPDVRRQVCSYGQQQDARARIRGMPAVLACLGWAYGQSHCMFQLTGVCLPSRTRTSCWANRRSTQQFHCDEHLRRWRAVYLSSVCTLQH